MRAAAILGLGSSVSDLKAFQTDLRVEWSLGLPARQDDADVILIFGGDGTIHRHLAPVSRLQRPVLVVPHGSGNDFARALGLLKVRDSLAAWQRFIHSSRNVRSIDLGTITPVGDNPLASSAYSLPRSHLFCC